MNSAPRYIRSISGLRAIAVLSILIYHISSAWLPGGFVGVDVFFVISGFVVAHSVANQPQTGFADYVAGFYKRRFRRILPASYAYIAAAMVLGILVIPLTQQTRLFEPAGAAAAVGASNFVLFASEGDYFSTSSELNPFTHTWSLAVEEQYYAIFPFLSYFILIRREPRARRLAIIVLALLAIASLALAVLTSARAPTFAFYLLPARFWELALGFGLRLVLGHLRASDIATALRPAAGGLSAIALLALGYGLIAADPAHFPIPGAILPCLATAGLIAIAWLFPGCLVDRVLAHPLPVWFGTTSYSLYLWHWGVIVAMRWTCGIATLPQQLGALGLSILLGWLSWRLVEQRFNRREGPQPVPPVRVFAAFGALCGVIMATSAAAHFAKPVIGLPAADRRAVWDPYAVPPLAGACARTKIVTPIGKGMRISFGPPCPGPAPHRLYVIGDSHAGAYLRAAWQISNGNLFRVEILSLGGCRVVSPIETPPVDGCPAFLDAALRTVAREARPGDVVLLAGLQTRRYVNAGAPVAPRAVSAAAIDASRRRLAAFAALPVSIVVEAAKPLAAVPQFQCADWFNRGNPVCHPPVKVDPQDLWQRMQDANAGIARIVAGMPDVSVRDPARVLCKGQRCDGYRDGKPVYFDTDHLSAYGNDLLRPALLDMAKAASQAGLRASPARQTPS